MSIRYDLFYRMLFYIAVFKEAYKRTNLLMTWLDKVVFSIK